MSTTLDALNDPNPDPQLAASLSEPATFLRRIPWAWIAFAFLLVVYSVYIFTHHAPSITEPDDNGYFAQGTLWATTGQTWFTPQSDAQYIGMHWLITPSGNYISRYPPGLAVLIGVVYKIGGYTAAALVNPVLSILGLAGVFFVARRLTASSAWALAAMIILGSNPTYVRHALAGDSHMGVACAIAWGLFFLLKWADQPKWYNLLFAGLVLGTIPTIRYPDAIMGLGVILFLAWNFPRIHALVGNRIWLHYLAIVAGALVPLLPLLIRNQQLMGAFWRTGYALTNEQTGFSWAFFNEHAIDYIRTLNANGLGLILALGLLGMTWMICIKRTRAFGIAAVLMTIPMLLLYMAYYWAPQMNSSMTMRFLLPTFVVYVLAAAWALSELSRNVASGGTALRIALPLVIIAVQLLWGTRETMDAANHLAFKKEGQARVAAALYAVTQQDDVVVAGNNVLQNLDFVRKWKLADQSLVNSFGRGFGGGGGGGGGGFGGNRDPDAPSPMQAEKQEKRKELYTGTSRENRKKFAADVRTWAGDHKIYFVGTERELSTLRAMGGDTRIIEKVALPEAPPQRQRESLMGAGMRNRTNAGNNNNRNSTPNTPNDAQANNNRNPQPGPDAAPPGPPDANAPGQSPPIAGGPGGFGGGPFGGGPGGGFGGGGPGGGGPGGGFGGRGGFGGGGGGGMMGGFGNEKEIVIAEWILPEAK